MPRHPTAVAAVLAAAGLPAAAALTKIQLGPADAINGFGAPLPNGGGECNETCLVDEQ
eukprot:gene11810-10219_t